jgi:hypothetical protein
VFPFKHTNSESRNKQICHNGRKTRVGSDRDQKEGKCRSWCTFLCINYPTSWSDVKVEELNVVFCVW